MPNFRVPRVSGVHRIAAIALYRALLTQSRAAPLAETQRDALQNLVRNRFKQSQHVHSIRRLRLSFDAGYEAIDYLDDALAGSNESKEYIAELLERAPARAKEAPERKKTKKEIKRAKAEERQQFEPEHPKISLFDRPLPLEKLSGKRHVPVLFSANRIPVLRLKKPQPRSLSRYIQGRIKQRQKWHDQRQQLQDEQLIAEREDEWDDLIAEDIDENETHSMLHGDVLTNEPEWIEAVTFSHTKLIKKIKEEKEKNRIMAEKMQAVVDRERELFEKEKRERQEAKWRQRIERKRLSREGEGENHMEMEVK